MPRAAVLLAILLLSAGAAAASHARVLRVQLPDASNWAFVEFEVLPSDVEDRAVAMSFEMHGVGADDLLFTCFDEVVDGTLAFSGFACDPEVFRGPVSSSHIRGTSRPEGPIGTYVFLFATTARGAGVTITIEPGNTATGDHSGAGGIAHAPRTGGDDAYLDRHEHPAGSPRPPVPLYPLEASSVLFDHRVEGPALQHASARRPQVGVGEYRYSMLRDGTGVTDEPLGSFSLTGFTEGAFRFEAETSQLLGVGDDLTASAATIPFDLAELGYHAG